eukprot:5176105-Alexandrium_andersonii.AAC.1
MSASLVGSEMCIRDRFRTLPLSDRVGYPAARNGHSHVDCSAFRAAWGGCCLLYTSDAADDM